MRLSSTVSPAVSRVEHICTPVPTSPDLNRTIDGRYVLKRLLAKGGTANVYAAIHRFTRRAVVLKYPLSSSERAIQRARTEIDALVLAQGPGVVNMLDAAEIDGRPCIVFDLLDGRTLAGLVTARGRLGVDETVRVGLELCRILERCHAAGVTHRDIKPSNLFITMDGENQVVLLDFGIARIVAPDAPRDNLTLDGNMVGTPEYMAPEALFGLADADQRVDVYATGVVLYECLTGAVPFAHQHRDMLRKVSGDAPRSISDLRSDVPEQLERIVAKCLMRSADERYRDAAQLREALQQCASPGVASVRLLTGTHERATTNSELPPTVADVPNARKASRLASRRRYPRAAYTTLARISLQNGQSVDGRVEEISEGGLQFVGEHSVPVGEEATIRYGLPTSGRIVELAVTARWTRTTRGSNATGFEFHDLTGDGREEIRHYVAFMCSEGGRRHSPPGAETHNANWNSIL